MNTKIFVMTHKKCVIPKDSSYVALHVGRACSDDLGYLGDNTGDNISEYNYLFGELTGLYWIWKNYEGKENIGICHYRRFFTQSEDGKESIMTGDTYDELLSNYDVIATDMDSNPNATLREGYGEAHNIHDLETVESAVKRLYPEDYAIYEDVLNGHCNYYGNLCVMPRDIFDAYCEWLFSILFEASKEIDVSGYDAYHKRVYGFLSEPFLLTWIKKNNLSAYESKVALVDEKVEKKELKASVGVLLKNGKPEEAFDLFQGILKIRPDIALPASDILKEIPLISDILQIIILERTNGEEGMYSVSHDIDVLLEHYKNVFYILQRFGNGDKQNDDVNYLSQNNVTSTAINCIIKANRYDVLGGETLKEYDGK